MTSPNPGPESVFESARVAALICAYQEERSIYDVATRVMQQLPQLLVVDDGSADATAAEARRAGAEVVTHAQNSGKGAAIKTGLLALAARPGIRNILLLDADGQHLPEEIPRFLAEAMASNASIIVGNRFGDVRTMPMVRKLTNRFMSWQISRLCGQIIPDTQCGFRMLRTDLIPLLSCESNHFDYETEMLIQAARQGHRISSAPVSTVYGDEKSKISPIRDTIRFLKLIWKHQ